MLEELYVGADAAGRKKLARVERDFDKIGRLLVPSLNDWTRTGEALARIGAKYGYEQIGRGRLTNDTLIGASAARLGITLLTVNERDFARIADIHSPKMYLMRWVLSAWIMLRAFMKNLSQS